MSDNEQMHLEVSLITEELELDDNQLKVYEFILEADGWVRHKELVERFGKQMGLEEVEGIITELMEKEGIVRKTINGERKWYCLTPKGELNAELKGLQAIYR